MDSYGQLSTAFYDLDKPVAPPDAVAFYRARAARSDGPILEPMCGSGRFLIPLLQAGAPIEGVDASAEMLAACRSRAKTLRLVPKLYEQSLENLALPQQYGLAFIPAGSLGLIHQIASLRTCLLRLRQHLRSGATLLVEFMDVGAVDSDADESGSRSVDSEEGRSIHYAWRSTRNQNDRTVHYDSRYQLREGDTVLAEESENLVLKMYTSQEVLHELHLAGFSGARALPSTDDTSWLRASGCALYECEVRGGCNTDA